MAEGVPQIYVTRRNRRRDDDDEEEAQIGRGVQNCPLITRLFSLLLST